MRSRIAAEPRIPGAYDAMTTRSPLPPLSPQMRDVLDRIRRAKRPPFHTLTPQQARAAYAAAAEVLDLPRAPLARVEDFKLPAADGQLLDARLYAPSHAKLPVLLFLHGGGFVIGGLETHDSLCRQFALHSGAAVVSLDYRLAPEHRFPMAVDDSWAAMHWLAAHADTLGLDGRRLAVGGDSAGGTLAATCALHARDSGLALAFQLLITPGTAASADTPSHGPSRTASAGRDHRLVLRSLHRSRAASDWRFAPLNADSSKASPQPASARRMRPLVDEGIAYGDSLRQRRRGQLNSCAA
jgi:acetyl esterase